MSRWKVVYGLLACVALLGGVVQTRADDGAAVSLKFDTGPVVGKILTPAEACRGGRMLRWRGGTYAAEIAGRKVAMRAVKKGNAVILGVDADGDGAITAREAYVIGPAGARVVLKIPDAPEALQNYPLLVSKVNVYKSATGGETVYAYVTPGFCMTGRVGAEIVRLYDDNLDGKFTQDGGDAIAIGRSVCAVPLMKVHQIGKDIQDLTVSADGASLTATVKANVPLGEIERPFRGKPLKCLVLVSKDGAFDVLVSGKTGVPAGQYRLAYGVLAGGGQMLPFRPSYGRAEPLTYPIEAGMRHDLRIGEPYELTFSASLKGADLAVGTSMQVRGAGGEEYLIDYVGGVGRPYVTMAAGNRVASRDRMKFG